MYRLIYETLLGDAMWNFIGVVLFCDAAFTSTKLFRELFEKRSISAVGTINASMPEKGGNGNSWPHQKFKTQDTQYLPRGWMRAISTYKTEIRLDASTVHTCTHTHARTHNTHTCAHTHNTQGYDMEGQQIRKDVEHYLHY